MSFVIYGGATNGHAFHSTPAVYTGPPATQCCSHRTNGSTHPDCGCQKSLSPSKVLFFSPLRGNTVPDRLKKLEFGPKMHPHRAQYEIYHKWGYAEADRKWPPRIYRACGPPTGPPDPTQPLPPLPLAQCCVELARSRAFPT